MTDSIATTVASILQNTLGVTADQISPSAQLMGDLGADSLDVVEIILEIEQAFEIEIPDADFPVAATVQQVIDSITRIKG
jgi:acyl carrier protein